uniref:Putative secreted protein n=1 Tax=Anopheles darlingi TaxID=43151 RepID=A0A2M4D320_ANODA
MIQSMSSIRLVCRMNVLLSLLAQKRGNRDHLYTINSTRSNGRVNKQHRGHNRTQNRRKGSCFDELLNCYVVFGRPISGDRVTDTIRVYQALIRKRTDNSTTNISDEPVARCC